jgi:spore germination protein GerM
VDRRLQVGLLFVVVLTAIAAFYFVGGLLNIGPLPEEDVEPVFESASVPLYEPTDPPIQVKLFFPATSNDVLLRTRDMTIFASAEIENRVRQIVEHLIRGADDDDIYGRLPQGTELSEAFVSDTGLLYLDFNTALSDNHPGGVLPEQATLYSIVNSLVYNIDEVTRVKILIGGIERETLAGHCLLLLPLETDFMISDFAPPLAPSIASNMNDTHAN